MSVAFGSATGARRGLAGARELSGVMRSTSPIRFLFVALTLVAVCVTPPVRGQPPTEATLTDEQRQLNLDSFDYVWTTVRDKYFDPELGGLDWAQVREELRPRMEQASSSAVASGEWQVRTASSCHLPLALATLAQ